MSLTQDQRALLGLLLAGDRYEQIAEVLGEPPEGVRARAHEAAAALEESPEREFPGDAVKLRLQQLDGAAPQPSARAEGDGRRWIPWAAAAAALVVVAVVLVVVLAGGGDESSSPEPGVEGPVAVIRMRPVGEARGTGTVTIARATKQPLVQVNLLGLAPTTAGQTYVLWFVGSGDRSMPIAFQGVGPGGRMTGRTPLTDAAIGLLPSFEQAVLTLAARKQAASAITESVKSQTLPRPVGEPVLRGSISG
jgi:hypothetical protein